MKQLTAKNAEREQENFDEVKAIDPKEKQLPKAKPQTESKTPIKRAKKGTQKVKKPADKLALNTREQALFDRLKSLQKELSIKNGKTASYGLPDTTLRKLIAKSPSNKTEMLAVSGVGELKFGFYGKEILELLNEKNATLTLKEQVLFKALKSLRLEQATKEDKKAFQVFHDKTLLDMIAKRPNNKEEMLAVLGVGEKKFAQYGESFLELVSDCVDESKIRLRASSFLEDSEHYDYLLKNIAQSKTRLVIISGWISEYVVDNAFLILIRKKLDQGVKIYIGYGYQDHQGNHKPLGRSQVAINALQNLMSQYPEQLFIACFATHRKMFLLDSNCVVIGSANWLSNRKYKNSECSSIHKDYETVEYHAAQAIKLIKEKLID